MNLRDSTAVHSNKSDSKVVAKQIPLKRRANGNKQSLSTNKRKATTEEYNPTRRKSARKKATRDVETSVNYYENQSQANYSIDHLPDELMLMIFSYLPQHELPKMSSVSQRWNDIAHDRTLWYAVTADGTDYSTSQLNTIIQEFPLLRELTITNRTDCNEVLDEVCMHSRELQSLTIISCRGSDSRKNILSKTMVNVLKACSKLTSLTIEGATFRSCEFYRYLLGDMQGKLKKLKLTVNPNEREWQCLYKAQALQQLVIRETPPLLA